MSTQKEIKERIETIRKIAKITNALEVISLTRLRRIEKKVESAANYLKLQEQIIQALRKGLNFSPHAFFSLPDTQKPYVLCIGSDKGLCGGFNTFVIQEAQKLRSDFPSAKVILAGKKMHLLLKLFKQENVLRADDYANFDVSQASEEILKALADKSADGFFIIYNQFRLNLTGKASRKQIFPLPLPEDKKQDKDYIFEGERGRIFDAFFRDYIKEVINSAWKESKAAEEFTRLVTMKQATDNAREVEKKIYLEFHKLRQAKITEELNEISALLRN